MADWGTEGGWAVAASGSRPGGGSGWSAGGSGGTEVGVGWAAGGRCAAVGPLGTTIDPDCPAHPRTRLQVGGLELVIERRLAVGHRNQARHPALPARGWAECAYPAG